jgi:Protein of unknown function (DUF541)
MNLRPTFTRPTKSVLTRLVVVAIASLAIGWTAGTVVASNGARAASPTAAPNGAAANQAGVPGTGTTTNLSQSGNVTTTSGGTASLIAYPVPGYNSLGVAPEGTILAEGTGTAVMKADGSDKAAALKKAIDAALADARAQALAAAASMGVQLQGIYSVSIEPNTSYTYPTPGCPVAPLTPGLNGATGSAGSAPANPPVICPLATEATPTSAELVVTLIVAYKYA